MRLRKYAATIVAALIIATAAKGAAAQTLTDSDVAAALALAAKKPAEYIASDGAGMFDVYVVGRLGRIAMAAEEGKRNYKPLQSSDVSEELRRDEVRVDVIPQTPVVNRLAGGFVIAPPFTAIVLKGADGSVVQPLSLERTPHSWGNNLGAKLNADGATLTFPPLPKGDFTIVIVAPDREYAAEFRGKNRQKIQ